MGVTVVALDVSLGRLDGGGKRVEAFLHALRSGDIETETIGVGPRGVQGTDKAVSSPLHIAKRRLLPVQLRSRVEAELRDHVKHGPVISLIPSANRWATRGSPTWLDYPDLWSNLAKNHASSVDRISGGINRVQARIWSRREVVEYTQANVVTTASLSDCKQLGPQAVWLPTPVADNVSLQQRRPRHPHRSPKVTYGMIANFDYPPNKDAYTRLIKEWLPVLLPSTERVVVAGFGSDNLTKSHHVDILGPVDDLATFYDRVDVVVAPIYLGAGMKVKVVEAMMYGVPVLASKHARSGLPESIADECIPWESAASEISSPGQLRDPRTNTDIVAALRHFTNDYFNRIFQKTWTERMADHR